MPKPQPIRGPKSKDESRHMKETYLELRAKTRGIKSQQHKSSISITWLYVYGDAERRVTSVFLRDNIHTFPALRLHVPNLLHGVYDGM
jgi:hypothetical protein